MIKRTSKRSAPLPPFENGQVWQLQDSSVLIGLVGKRLVHFKHYSATVKRPSTQLAGKERLEQFLRKHAAILMPHTPLSVPVGRNGDRELSSSTNKSNAMTKAQPTEAAV